MLFPPNDVVNPGLLLLFIFSARSSLSPGTSALECKNIDFTSTGKRQNGFLRDFLSSESMLF